MPRRRVEKQLVVGIAADDAVEDDDVGCFDALGVGRDVVQAPIDARLQTRFAQEPSRVLVVAGRELEVDRPRGAPLEQLELDVADTAADLEDGGTLEPPAFEELDHAPRDLVEALRPVTLGHAPGEAR